MKNITFILTKKGYRDLQKDNKVIVSRQLYGIVLISVTVRKIKGKLGFDINTPDDTFLKKAQAIYTALDLDTAGYYDPAFSEMKQFLDGLINFKQGIDNMALGTILGAEGAKTTAKSDLKDILDDALIFVNKIARGDQNNAVEIITGAKMELVKEGKQDKPDFEVRQGSATTNIDLIAKAEKIDNKYIKTTYYWQFSIDDGKTWESLEETMVAHNTAIGMLTGIPTLFRKRTKTTKGGMSPWSAPIEITPK